MQDGIIRNLEIIGEAVKKMPDNMKQGSSGLDWENASNGQILSYPLGESRLEGVVTT